MLILSLFPGIGLLDRAFEEEGFCVVRGPDVLWGGDIREFHPSAGVFEGLTGGPPCQCFSPLANLVRARGAEPRFGNLIPEFERCVQEAHPQWFLMENVPQAPAAKVEGYMVHSFILDNVWLGEEQRRKRRFTFGSLTVAPVDLRKWIRQAPLELPRTSGGVTQNRVNNSQEAKRRQMPTVWKGARQKAAVTSAHSGYSLEEACRLQGLPDGFLDDAPFTKHAKLQVVANGVPLPMGRALAKAVREARTR